MKYCQKGLIAHECVSSQEGSGAATMEGSGNNNVREKSFNSNFWPTFVSIFHIRFFQFSYYFSTLFNFLKTIVTSMSRLRTISTSLSNSSPCSGLVTQCCWRWWWLMMKMAMMMMMIYIYNGEVSVCIYIYLYVTFLLMLPSPFQSDDHPPDTCLSATPTIENSS